MLSDVRVRSFSGSDVKFSTVYHKDCKSLMLEERNRTSFLYYCVCMFVEEWQRRFDAGHMLISGAGDKGAQLGNGYAAFFVQSGAEFVAGRRCHRSSTAWCRAVLLVAF